MITLNVAMMWDHAPQADVDGITLWFFSTSASRPQVWQFEVAGREGGSVELPTGRYTMLTVNNDLPGVDFNIPATASSLEAMARPRSNATVMPTGMLYGSCVTDIELTSCGLTYRLPDGSVKECPMNLLRCYPDSMATVYNVLFTDITGIEMIRDATARLSGVATVKNVASGSTGDLRSAVDFTVTRSGTSLNGSTSALGSPASTPDFKLTLTARLNNGSTFVETFDVTEQILNYPNLLNVYIYIPGIDFSAAPPQGGDDSGVDMEVGVDNWNAVEIDITTSLNNKIY